MKQCETQKKPNNTMNQEDDGGANGPSGYKR